MLKYMPISTSIESTSKVVNIFPKPELTDDEKANQEDEDIPES
jgi:hypothetical protein